MGEMDLESPEALHGLLLLQKELMMPFRAAEGDIDLSGPKIIK